MFSKHCTKKIVISLTMMKTSCFTIPDDFLSQSKSFWEKKAKLVWRFEVENWDKKGIVLGSGKPITRLPMTGNAIQVGNIFVETNKRFLWPCTENISTPFVKRCCSFTTIFLFIILLTLNDDGSCGWDVVANGGKKCQKKISTENGFACVEKRRHQNGLVKKRLRWWWWM